MSSAEASGPFIEWGVSTRPAPGEVICGDACLVAEWTGGALAAVIDGLGHGGDAAAAARVAADVLRAGAGQPLEVLFKRCNESLSRTRGAAISAATFSAAEGTMEWAGVGNVEGVLIRIQDRGGRDHESLLLRGGVVGYYLPTYRRSIVPLSRGDILVFATDGVHAGFAAQVRKTGTAQAIADRILSACARGTDDALVMVVRYLGEGARNG